MSETVLSDCIVRARYDRICDECGCTIPKGETYRRRAIVNMGTIHQWTAHLDCSALALAAWRLGSVWDDVPLISDMEPGELDYWRGFYPHAVTRVELSRELADLRWQQRRLANGEDAAR